MFEQILVPVDGSESGQEALDLAIGMQKVHFCSFEYRWFESRNPVLRPRVPATVA
jgi:hypothetical protein